MRPTESAGYPVILPIEVDAIVPSGSGSAPDRVVKIHPCGKVVSARSLTNADVRITIRSWSGRDFTFTLTPSQWERVVFFHSQPRRFHDV